ncbi:PREDICTED: LOW QUALITY PROTEIN: putative neuroblastoma breakpoint family member 7 [Ceratotherium simum simum]|uniref:LOW QUALITY PROTEIN: putative neuroblastoma breakpoint family member 7 n=1 Tax=Ceratotherium simum simum TaxID=73337 RepID=A0ABM1C756_CERSS|nr:PREDICTED: LOW QUALITY PROTEIN: putative neuroblastoma breakpoint family member 7 [Ceratotherium simum simum]
MPFTVSFALQELGNSHRKLDDLSWPNNPGPQPDFSLSGYSQHLGSMLAQSSQHYQGLQRKLLISSLARPLLPHITICLSPLSDLRADMTTLEIKQELQSQLAKSKQDFRDLREKFLISQATAYILANQLQKYKCEECEDIIESVLKKELHSNEGNLAEKSTLAQKLREYSVLIQEQEQQLTRLWQRLQEERDISVLLSQHLKDLLTHNDLDNYQGQGFRERLAEGHRLAESTVCKLSPENHEDEEDEYMELQEVEKKEVQQDSQDQRVLPSSICQEVSDCDQPYSDGKLSFAEQEVSPAPDVACECSHSKRDETPNDLPENQNDQEEEDGQQPMSPSNLESVDPGELTNSGVPAISCALLMELQKFQKKEILQDSQDECALPSSICQEESDCDQPYSEGKLTFDEQEVGSALDVGSERYHSSGDEIPTHLPECNHPSLNLFAENQNDHEEVKGQGPIAPRLCRELPQEVEDDLPWDPLDEYYLNSSDLPSLSNSYCPYRSAVTFSFEELAVYPALDRTSEYSIVNDSVFTNPSCLIISPPNPIRLRKELTVVEENEVPQDLLDECYLTHSIGQDLSASCRLYRRASLLTDEQEVFSALDVHKLGLEAYIGMKNPPKLEGDAVEGSATSTDHTNALSALKQRILRRKLRLGKRKPGPTVLLITRGSFKPLNTWHFA